MKTEPFKFFKTDGRWESKINPAFVVHMKQTHGLPEDVTINFINALSPKERTELKLRCWGTFVKDNNIDIEPIKQENLKRKEEYIERLRDIYETAQHA